MIILISSKIGRANLQGSLGKPEYSYYFLMQEFLPALEALATVISVKSREEIEALHARYCSQGETVVYINAGPPHQTLLDLPCPTIALFAWEFDSLPCMAWDDDPRNDWRHVFAHIQGAIATSREAAELTRQAAHSGFPVIALPAPIWDRYANLGTLLGHEVALSPRSFPFAGTVIDSPILGLSADGLVRKPVPVQEEIAAPEPTPTPPPPSVFSQAWQRSVELLKGWWQEVRTPAPAEPPQVQAAPLQDVAVNGVVYTTVLNPADGRKNWVDIITAFCWAFKDRGDATLIVKMTHHDLEFYRVVLMTLLSRLAPFSCRVVVLHGFLDDEQYRDLIKASTYYVNASSGEGLCLPLMEFLSSGRPAIAPVHTAMTDYLSDEIAFPLRHAVEPTCWPHDPTGMLFTHRHRINWQSLMEAFRASHRLALEKPNDYRCMSGAAHCRMRDFASCQQVIPSLKAFLTDVVDSARGKEERRA
jgi:glycosyltransferase involved in cell wall biosynthesis